MDVISNEVRQLNNNNNSYLSYLPKDMLNIIIDLSRSKSNKYNQQYIFKKFYKLRKYLCMFKYYHDKSQIFSINFFLDYIFNIELTNLAHISKKYQFNVKIIGKLKYIYHHIDMDVIKVIEYPQHIQSYNKIKRICIYKSYNIEFYAIFYSEYDIYKSYGFNVMKITRLKNE